MTNDVTALGHLYMRLGKITIKQIRLAQEAQELEKTIIALERKIGRRKD